MACCLSANYLVNSTVNTNFALQNPTRYPNDALFFVEYLIVGTGQHSLNTELY